MHVWLPVVWLLKKKKKKKKEAFIVANYLQLSDFAIRWQAPLSLTCFPTVVIGVTAFWGSSDTGKVGLRVLPSMVFVVVVVWIDVKNLCLLHWKVIIILLGTKYVSWIPVQSVFFVCYCFLSSVPWSNQSVLTKVKQEDLESRQMIHNSWKSQQPCGHTSTIFP